MQWIGQGLCGYMDNVIIVSRKTVVEDRVIGALKKTTDKEKKSRGKGFVISGCESRSNTDTGAEEMVQKFEQQMKSLKLLKLVNFYLPL